MQKSLDTYETRREINISGTNYTGYFLTGLEKHGINTDRLPFSIKVLLENLLRYEDGKRVTKEDIRILANWSSGTKSNKEISYMPARVLMQDFTGIPAIVDLAAMRNAVMDMGGNPEQINPLLPTELVIDHSVQIDRFGDKSAFEFNIKKEFERNQERYAFLKWGQSKFNNFKVVPPDTGIIHQINLEYLGRVVFESDGLLYPDTVVGTDSHTTMINSLGIIGWGVGGIEAEAATLGLPITMLIPEVVGVRLSGTLPPGVTPTDLVLTITKTLRQVNVVGKFVEYFGPGLDGLSLEDRAVISNMSPEYGSTIGFFPVDKQTLQFLKTSNRDTKHIERIEAYIKMQGMFRTDKSPEPEFSQVVEISLSEIEPSMAGPKRPQDLLKLSEVKTSFRKSLAELIQDDSIAEDDVRIWMNESNTEGNAIKTNLTVEERNKQNRGRLGKIEKEIIVKDGDTEFTARHGQVVIASITSCTNTSNPSLMITAGLVAKKAVKLGLKSKPWVKTSLAPGSKVATRYLDRLDLTRYFEKLKFHNVGYGCATCIGNSGPLPKPVANAVLEGDLMVASVLSGNRNFEGRINPMTRINYLASPPLVVIYALAGTVDINLNTEPVARDTDGKGIYLSDLWPTDTEINDAVREGVNRQMFEEVYNDLFAGEENWHKLETQDGDIYNWSNDSTYIKQPSFFKNMTKTPPPLKNINSAHLLALLGDSITTDHISPAGAIPVDSPAGKYLLSAGVTKEQFNSFGSRRGNHEVMVRGTFGNIRLKNLLTPGKEGNYTRHIPSGETTSIYDAAQRYAKENRQLIIIAGKEYGTGSSRDWAAKGTFLLGVKAVLAESYERIHRSNLVGMGVLPLQFVNGAGYKSLGITGEELFDITGISDNLKVSGEVNVTKTSRDGSSSTFTMAVRIDTPEELEYYRHGGILQYVLRGMV